MQKKQVAIQVEQSVKYAETKERDHWFHETTAEFLQLATFSKVTYEQDGERIEIKWQGDKADNQWNVTIKRGHNTMRFDTRERTSCHYQTPQGTWLLEVVTQSIQFGWQKNQKTNTTVQRMSIYYELYNAEQLVGSYVFSLIYAQ